MSAAVMLVEGQWESVITAWLAEHIKNSKRTAQAYADYLAGWKYDAAASEWTLRSDHEAVSFRAYLMEHGYDLGAAAGIVALHAQAWAMLPHSRKKKPVSASTHNLRLAALSSFYEYAIRHEMYAPPNPIERVKRMKRQMYTGAHPLHFEDGELEAQLEAISTKTPNGMRDKAMLYLALYTGRRLAEIANLQCGDIETAGSTWYFHWRHAKGNKALKNELPKSCPAVAHLARWLKKFYGTTWPPDKPVFPALARNSYGERMTAQGIEQRCERWLDTSRFHRLRHTFSALYLEAGGTVQGLSGLLGHSSLSTTATYIPKLTEGRNEQIGVMRDILAGKKKRS